MHGKILGFSGGKGIVIGEEGERFPFAETDWMEDEAPQKGDEVDFSVGDDGAACDIYLSLDMAPPKAKKRARPTLETKRLADSDTLRDDMAESLRKVAERDDFVGDSIARIRAVPQIVLAALIIIASLAMGFAKIGYENPTLQDFGYAGLPNSITLISIPDETSAVHDALTDQRENIDEALDDLDTRAKSSAGRSASQMEIKRNLSKAASALAKLDRLLSISYALWIVPLLAAVVAVLGWLQYGAAKPLGIVLGAASIGAALYLYLWEKMTIDLIEAVVANRDLLATARRAAQKSLELEGGGWLIIAAGIGCIILGLIRQGDAAIEEDYS